jgi:hypothetical protein
LAAGWWDGKQCMVAILLYLADRQINANKECDVSAAPDLGGAGLRSRVLIQFYKCLDKREVQSICNTYEDNINDLGGSTCGIFVVM